jgi:3-deoxy-D-manno-octulosonic-acid transferase/heptosyltransferase-1
MNFPNARIDWLVESEAAPIVEGHEAVDRLFVSRRKPWRNRIAASGRYGQVLQEVLRFVKEVRGCRYDAIIDLQGLLKSAVWVGLARGGAKIGLAGSREGAWMAYNRPPVPVDYDRHAIDRYLQAAEHLNCRRGDWDGRIPVSPKDRQRVEELTGCRRIHDMRLVAVNPMARWTTKLWRPERFSELADRIARELSCHIVFTGSSADRAVIESIRGRMKHRALDLVGKTTLKELACLYSLCRVVVCTDTGPMHIAAAMGRPVVALFGPTSPLRTGPYGIGHRVLRAEGMACSPCFKKRCDQTACMDAIQVEDVFTAVKEVSDA